MMRKISLPKLLIVLGIFSIPVGTFWFSRRSQKGEKNATAFLELGKNLKKTDKWEEKVSILKRFIEQNPDSSYYNEALASLIHTLLENNQKNEAQKYLEQIKQSYLSSPIVQATILFSEASLEIEEGKWESARSKAQIVANTEFSPFQYYAHILLAHIAREQNQPEEAFTHLKKVIQTPPASQEPYEEVLLGKSPQTLATQLLSLWFPERLQDL